ncbi:helix-turn-helix domain-containing protein [Streptococcus acidominimus]|uniref:XRE family transcriptional regulator n=1 Tax=Streptococcus acidominimus TaxID=1326 RepID=A0A4Y9FRL3_STRAI|nr:helix-turn-helix transcriptional regulator [Streptococcus acidominimus]MBF0817855.1 helix-turn-helix transcriptional regulator [Streptococcus acidominimus]MBF0838371.1 helix-turn-helix transcriptional regulator [Streptococcus acidominimus]MBF0846266.1 helix-turn-helix transcriptional regulator [Streptococcus danieliae]TFU31844.1 XRE family transcriptional regulator [Streptococcus acidominimus]
MFPERLKKLREEAGITQTALAKILQTSQPSYQNWEKGTRNPSRETLKKIAEFFNVSTDFLLGNSDIKTPTNNLDFDKVKESLKNSLGFTGEREVPEEELEEMARAFIEHFSNVD